MNHTASIIINYVLLLYTFIINYINSLTPHLKWEGHTRSLDFWVHYIGLLNVYLPMTSFAVLTFFDVIIDSFIGTDRYMGVHMVDIRPYFLHVGIQVKYKVDIGLTLTHW